MTSKVGELSMDKDKARPRLICVPTFVYRILGGIINRYVMLFLKSYDWSVCGKDIPQVNASIR